MGLTRFVSPNLKHKNGKIYILNKFEINRTCNYEEENYYIHFDDIDLKEFNDYHCELKLNEYSDDVLVEMNHDNSELDNNEIINKINNYLCGLY